jgi:hypothetical protein
MSPEELPAGETTPVIITGNNLDAIASINLPDNDLIQIEITSQTSTQIEAEEGLGSPSIQFKPIMPPKVRLNYSTLNGRNYSGYLRL